MPLVGICAAAPLPLLRRNSIGPLERQMLRQPDSCPSERRRGGRRRRAPRAQRPPEGLRGARRGLRGGVFGPFWVPNCPVTWPSEVVIIGAGTVGEFAARAAIGLGASVRVFDASPYRLRRLRGEIGGRLWTSTLHPKILAESLANANVAIGAVRPHHGRTPMIVTEAMVQGMREGSIVVDVSIDSGGCFETSRLTNHQDPVFVEHGVTHYGVANIPSRVPRTASLALSNQLGPLLQKVGEYGGIGAGLEHSPMIRSGLYLFRGNVVNQDLAEAFGWPYKDLRLLLAAYE